MTSIFQYYILLFIKTPCGRQETLGMECVGRDFGPLCHQCSHYGWRETERDSTPSPEHSVMVGTMTIVWTDRPVTWLHHEAATMLICGHHRNKTPVPPLNIAPNTCSRCLLQATLAPSTSHFFTSSKTLIVTEKQRSLCTHSICLASYILAICLHKDNIVY